MKLWATGQRNSVIIKQKKATMTKIILFCVLNKLITSDMNKSHMYLSSGDEMCCQIMAFCKKEHQWNLFYSFLLILSRDQAIVLFYFTNLCFIYLVARLGMLVIFSKQLFEKFLEHYSFWLFYTNNWFLLILCLHLQMSICWFSDLSVIIHLLSCQVLWQPGASERTGWYWHWEICCWWYCCF